MVAIELWLPEPKMAPIIPVCWHLQPYIVLSHIMLELVCMTNRIWPRGSMSLPQFSYKDTDSSVLVIFTLRSLSLGKASCQIIRSPKERSMYRATELLAQQRKRKTETYQQPGQWISQEADLSEPGAFCLRDCAKPLNKATPKFLILRNCVR